MPNLKSFGSLTLSLLAAGGMMFCAIHAIGLQHEWGYGAVRDLVGQADEMGQSIGSAIMRTVFIAPAIAGLAFGYLKQHFRGPSGWRIAAGLIPAGVLSLMMMDSSTNWSEILKVENLLFVGAMFSLFYAALFGGEKIFASLATRTRPWPILLPGLLALIPMMGLNQLEFMREDGSGWMLEAVVDGLITFGAAFAAVRWNSSKNLGTALTVAAFSAIPFIIANVWNIGSDLVQIALSPSKGSLNAEFSAMLITSLSVISTIAGASAALLRSKRAG